MGAHDGEVMLVTHAGLDTLHPAPQEQCNSDDAKHRGWVDELTAAKMIDGGLARWCAICGPDAEPTLNTRSDQ